MSEFNNRIDAQRNILQIVNKYIKGKEQLYSLSSKAIQRWSSVNNIREDSKLVLLIVESSEKLFFLANKSQEQITHEYKTISSEIKDISNNIKCLLIASESDITSASKSTR